MSIEKIERTPQRIVGDDAYMQLVFEGYAVVKADELSRLREALKPFARIADSEPDTPDGASTIVNISRCRDARRALSEREGQEE